DRDHHHRRGRGLAMHSRDILSERVTNNYLLERRVLFTKSQSARAETADRSCRHLDDPCRLVVDSEFGVNGASHKAHRLTSGFGGRSYGRLSLARKTRRRDVDGLFKERAVERVGLVEDRQHLEPSRGQQALERDLVARDELFEKNFSGRLAAASCYVLALENLFKSSACR